MYFEICISTFCGTRYWRKIKQPSRLLYEQARSNYVEHIRALIRWITWKKMCYMILFADAEDLNLSVHFRNC